MGNVIYAVPLHAARKSRVSIIAETALVMFTTAFSAVRHPDMSNEFTFSFLYLLATLSNAYIPRGKDGMLSARVSTGVLIAAKNVRTVRFVYRTMA